MRGSVGRFFAFWIACVISFCSTISPAYALTASFAGLPSINAIIRGTVGTFVDTSTGVTITRSAVAIAEGVSIPFAVAETATFAEVAAGGIAAGLATPGLALGVVVAAAIAYGWHKCFTAPSGWCRAVSGTAVNAKWCVGCGGPNTAPFYDAQHAIDDFCNRVYSGQKVATLVGSQVNSPGDFPVARQTFYCDYPGGGSRSGNNDATAFGQIITTTTDADQATDPIHAPDIAGLTQRAMAENKIRASDLAQAAQADGHPVDDPAVNPRLPTTVTATPTAVPPTVKVETSPDGTKTTTTCSGTADLGVSGSDNSTAVITKSASTNCTTVVLSPDGTTKTSSTTTSEAPKAATGPQECGSPGKPKCAIDETGTPTSIDLSAPVAELNKTVDDAKSGISDAAKSDGKDTSWKFSFNLPSSCSSLTLFAGVVVDFCSFKPIVHDLMSMVWVGSTVFCVVGMVGRTVRGTA